MWIPACIHDNFKDTNKINFIGSVRKNVKLHKNPQSGFHILGDYECLTNSFTV